jgi:hypothetical protein
MPYEIKSNAAQYADNLVQLPLVGSGDPLNNGKKVLARYRVSFLNTDLATMDRVVIGGATKSFVATWATTTAAGLAGIKAELQAIMDTLLGTNNGDIVISMSGTRVFITTAMSELKFEKCGISGTLIPFIPTDAEIVGTEDADVASPVIHVSLNAAGDFYTVKVKPVCGKSISAFNVDWNASTDEYDSVWPPIPSYSLPVGTTIVGGYVTFLVAQATGDSGAVLAISITPTGGSAIVYSQTLKLLDYNGQ